MRKLLATFAPGIALYFGQLYGERFLTNADPLIWDLMLYAAITLGIIGIASIDSVWNRVFAGWMPQLRIVWARDRNQTGLTAKGDDELEIIEGREFNNVEVQMDGKFFINCVFRNVTFFYHGTKNMRQKGSNIVGSILVRTDSVGISAYLNFVHALQAAPGFSELHVGEVDPKTGKHIIRAVFPKLGTPGAPQN